MRKQLQLQMQKQNAGDLRPKSREKQVPLIDPRKVRAKPQGPLSQKQRQVVQPKRVKHQEPSLDIAVDIAEQRLKNIHKEFRAVRVQAKMLEEAVNLGENDQGAAPDRHHNHHKLKQKDMNRGNMVADKASQQHNHAKQAQGIRAPEPRRRSAGDRSEVSRHRGRGDPVPAPQEPRRRSAGSDLNQRREPTAEVSSSDWNANNAKVKAQDAKMQRKLEANRRYEEQLMEARKSYYEEKKAAMQKKQDLYRESTPPEGRSRARTPPKPSQYEMDVNDVRNLNDYPDYPDEEEDLSYLRPIQEEVPRRNSREANERYEAQLEEARQAYYHEKKAALQKKQDLYKESNSPPTHSSPGEPSHYHAENGHHHHHHHHNVHNYQPSYLEEEESQEGFIVQEKMVYAQEGGDLDSFQVEESFVYNAIPEEPETHQEADHIDTGVFAQGGVVDKVNAIRDYCLEKLGSVLFHELCGLIKLHNSRALTSTSDVEYAGEILERLGEPRIHFAGLIDHLLYLEEQLY